jgi:hypothetical protein
MICRDAALSSQLAHLLEKQAKPALENKAEESVANNET